LKNGIHTFSTFNSFSLKNHVIKLSQTIHSIISNHNFVSPNIVDQIFLTVSGRNTLTDNSNVLPGWLVTVDCTGWIGYIKASNPGNWSTYLPYSSSNLPVTDDTSQVIIFKSNGVVSSYTIYQTVPVDAKTYTLSFYAAGRQFYYNTNNVFSVSINGTYLVQNQSTSDQNWTKYTYTYTAPFSGNVVFKLDVNSNDNSDSGILFADFVLN
jgi:hypothetical protein